MADLDALSDWPRPASSSFCDRAFPRRCGPREFGCSGLTCRRRLRDWQTVGVWPCSIACCSSSCRRPGIRTGAGAGPPSTAPPLPQIKRGGETGPNPTDRGPSRARSATLWSTGRAPSGCGEAGQPARQPDAGAYPRRCAKRAPRPQPCPQATDKLRADKACDQRRRRIERRKRAIKPHIAPRGRDSSERRGTAGSSSQHWRGSAAFAASLSAMSGAPTSMRLS